MLETRRGRGNIYSTHGLKCACTSISLCFIFLALFTQRSAYSHETSINIKSLELPKLSMFACVLRTSAERSRSMQKRSKTHVLYVCFTPAYFSASFLAYMRRGFYLVAFHIVIALPEGQSNQASFFLQQHDQARVRKYCSLKISRYLTL